MTRSPHRLIHASAGTGKTWELSGRFLKLCFAGVEPGRILATTFTRKAAGEIQDRVLERLAKACDEEKARTALAQQLGRDLDAAEARRLLARLTRRLDQLRVRTLDAFFVHLAKLFALELGLPPEWGIAEEAEDLLLQREAVARTLARTERLELIQLLRGLQQAEASRSVERVLLDEVKRGRNAFLDSRPEAWSRVQPEPGADDEGVEAALLRLLEVPLPRTRKGLGDVSANWKKEVPALAARVRARNWTEFIEKGLGAKVAAGERSYSGFDIPADMLGELELLVRQARHDLVAEVALFNAAALGWLSRFEESYEELKAEERAYRFEDLPKALHPRDERRLESLDQIWYRLDGAIDHVLLDEFQDTAPVQWRILEPLVSEILADGTASRSFFCVGDLKQSIYGFREAEPRLLASLHERFPVLEIEKLTKSYRSSAVILDTVRRTFESIGASPAFDRPEHAEAAREFQESFDAHEAAHQRPGAAFLVEAPRGEEDPQQAVLRLTAKRARAIHDEAPHATIGILVRRNQLIARLIFLLRDEGLRASGEGGNPLTDSMAVLHFLSLLHLSDHPGDTAAAFHVATSPLADLAGLTPEGWREQRSEVARVTRRRLALEGYGALAASFLAAVDGGYGPWDRRRFRQLVDLALAHDERAGPRADRFVDHVRVTRVEDPAATQVQVMTVHSAKGLEFDAVLLPELDVRFSLRESELFASRPDPAGLLETISHSRSEEVCKLHPELAALWSERARRELREALCLLYVAMTRARHRLDLLVQPQNDPLKTSHDFAGILRAALGRGPADAQGILWRHPESSERWIPKPPPAPAAAPPAPPSARPFRLATQPRSLPHRTPSAAEGGGEVTASELLRSPRSAARRTGDLVHLWLSQIEWLETFVEDEARLLALGRALVADEDLLRDALGELRAFLAQPTVRAELTRAGRPASPAGVPTVWRERAFALRLEEPDGSRALWSGSFDRVVLEGRPGAWTSAVVTDFKTDRVKPSELAERVAFYRPQLEGYRRVLARMTGLDPTRIEARLLFLRPDRVATL